MSDQIISYTKSHLPSIISGCVALLAAAAVLGKKNADVESLKQDVENLKKVQTSEISILTELRINQEWIIRHLKEGGRP